MSGDIENYTRLAGGKNDTCCPELTLRQRFTGLIFCAVFGLLLDALAVVILFLGTQERKVVAYAAVSTIGNFIAVMGTCFVWGFATQYKAVTHKKRACASGMYFGSMLATLIVAFTVHDPLRKLLLVLLLIVQYVSYIWYTLSFIPFARTAVKSCFRGITGN